MKTVEKTAVVFRRWKDSREVFALFPYEPHDPHGLYCTSYAHRDQHSGADFTGCMQRSKPVDIKDADAKYLYSELVRIGYDLKVIRRANNAYERRKAALKP